MGADTYFYTFMDRHGLVATFRIPVGKYEITAIRGDETLRQRIVDLQDTGVMLVDWSDLE